ncbi:UNVERIFIED_CONTAM: Homeobox-leucine zipper protein HAT14 [Sesamum calycinum]|uniref:Homeobox-leucine zipper protein HAT14 n=1 Tax=Sesamum calycinum TaxID=2727403 RepID=A0AAW2SZE7_9LAMI
MGLGLNFCLLLLNERNQSSKEKKTREDDDDDDDDQMSDGDHQGSDDALPENGSSGNMGLPAAARGLDVNRFPPAAVAEEVSSANSVGTTSPFRMEFGMFRSSTGNLRLGGQKREFEAATGNDVVESERGSDDDENGLQTRKKLRLSKEQSAFLEESFKEHSTLNPKQKLALANSLISDLVKSKSGSKTDGPVRCGFTRRTKLKQTEVDCEYLKRCCETLSEENRRLHKELQELRALKTSNPFYMPPAPLPCVPPANASPPLRRRGIDPKSRSCIPSPDQDFTFSQTPTGHPNQPAAS